MSYRGTPPRSTYEKARRREALRRLARVVRRRSKAPELLPLDEVTRRLRVFNQVYMGVRPIPVKDIVGTVSSTRDFDRDFLPRRREVGERWRRVEQAYPEGDFPPIVAYELDGRYFVVDGHHRVGIARQRGMDYVDGEVTRLRARWPLPPDADVGRLICAEQQRIFMEESGLERARPEARVEFTRPDGYIQLLEIVKIHGYHRMRERGEVMPVEEITGDWYDRVYLPTLEAIRAEGLTELAPRATEADLFLWVYRRQRDVFPERGGLATREAVRVARERFAEHERRTTPMVPRLRRKASKEER